MSKCMKIMQNIFSSQIVFVISMLVFLMIQMLKSERTLVNVSVTAITAMAVLISTGFVVLSAGDIVVEASNLSMAMYSSGWHNCQKNAFGMRQLVMIAMIRAQKPVILTGLGIMAVSYQSYLSWVKSSYCVFRDILVR